MSYIYLASPYSHSSHVVMQDRYKRAAAVTAHFLRNHRYVYSPIVHCHELARQHDLPRHFGFWQDYNVAMLRMAKELRVIPLIGWKDSKGVQYEIDVAKRIGIPVFFLTDDELREILHESSSLGS